MYFFFFCLFLGADPKSVLCAFYKQGHCGKGDKCKFSHDLTLERKAEKRSVYVDMRDDGGSILYQVCKPIKIFLEIPKSV